MQARFYLPMYGRFGSPDPGLDQHFQDTQSWNIYSYVRNSSVMNIDPNGYQLVPLSKAELEKIRKTDYFGNVKKVGEGLVFDSSKAASFRAIESDMNAKVEAIKADGDAKCLEIKEKHDAKVAEIWTEATKAPSESKATIDALAAGKQVSDMVNQGKSVSQAATSTVAQVVIVQFAPAALDMLKTLFDTNSKINAQNAETQKAIQSAEAEAEKKKEDLKKR